MNSRLCVMIGASVVLSQSQHISVSHYLPVWLRPKYQKSCDSHGLMINWMHRSSIVVIIECRVVINI